MIHFMDTGGKQGNAARQFNHADLCHRFSASEGVNGLVFDFIV